MAHLQPASKQIVNKIGEELIFYLMKAFSSFTWKKGMAVNEYSIQKVYTNSLIQSPQKASHSYTS